MKTFSVLRMQPYSVLMATYRNDQPAQLELSIESILNQSIPTDDFMIVADGPLTPELESVIDRFQKHSPAIHFLQLEQNVGLGAALNAGLKSCRNELVARMDADDIAYPDRMALQLQAFLDDAELTICGGFVHEFFDDSQKITATKVVPTTPDAIRRYGKRRNPFIHPTVMFKRSIILNLGGYSTLRRGQDYELFIRILATGYTGRNIDQAVLKFRSSQDMYGRRKSWLSTRTYIQNVYKSWKMGYAGLPDLLLAVSMRMTLFLMPTELAKIVYRKVMRRPADMAGKQNG